MGNEEKSDSIIDWTGGKEFKSVDAVLAELDLTKEGNAALSYNDFRSICSILFESEEIEKHERKMKEIFRIFDSNCDGVLKDLEWRTFCDWLHKIVEPVNVLLVVDVQNDFIDGSLAIRNCGCGQDGIDVINPINRLINEGRWDKIIYSLDWHPPDHISFYENLHLRELHSESPVMKENAKPFDTVHFSQPSLKQKLWPRHCVMNTWGSELHKDLVIAPDSEQVKKGKNSEIEAYSVFSNTNEEGSADLQNILTKIGGTHLYVCGLAYDVCVKETCLDGLAHGYALAVVGDCCRGVNLDDIERTQKLISDNGGLITNSNHVLSLVNDGKRSLIMSHQAAQKASPASSTFVDSTNVNSGNSS